MSIVDSISGIAIDTPIATIFDWTTDVIEYLAELVIVLIDMEGDSELKSSMKSW